MEMNQGAAGGLGASQRTFPHPRLKLPFLSRLSLVPPPPAPRNSLAQGNLCTHLNGAFSVFHALPPTCPPPTSAPWSATLLAASLTPQPTDQPLHLTFQSSLVQSKVSFVQPCPDSWPQQDRARQGPGSGTYHSAPDTLQDPLGLCFTFPRIVPLPAPHSAETVPPNLQLAPSHLKELSATSTSSHVPGLPAWSCLFPPSPEHAPSLFSVHLIHFHLSFQPKHTLMS